MAELPPSVSMASSSSDASMLISQLDVASMGEQEYETQFFGFTPKSFTDGLYNTVYEYIAEMMSAVEQFFNTCTELRGCCTEDQLKQSSAQILCIFKKNLDKYFDKFEGYVLANILHVPNTVVLPEDAIQQDHDYSFEDEVILDKEIKELKDKIIKTQHVNASLRQELRDIEFVKAECEGVVRQLDQIDKIAAAAGVTNFRDSLVFTSGKIAQLKELLDALPPVQMLDTLPPVETIPQASSE